MAVAAWSIRPWDPLAPFDPVEDTLHSAAATVVGFAFALGVATVGLGYRVTERRWRLLDVVGVLASVVLPMAMVAWPDVAGVLQRSMFALAYLWYAREALFRGSQLVR